MAKAKADSNGHWRNRIVGSDVVAADQLLANPYNWRIHPKHQQEALAASLNGVGWVQEIVVNQRSGHVIDGHLRAALAISRGEMVPVKYVDLSDDEERLVLATLDPLAALAATDRDMLEDILSGLRETELVQDDEALDKLLHEVAAGANVAYGEYAGQPDPGPQIDRAEELREKWQTACGQVWEAPSKTVPGRAHRLMCGDSTSAADVARLMAGEKAEMVWADPPYGVSIGEKNTKLNAIARSNRVEENLANDTLDEPELLVMLERSFDCAIEHCTAGGAWYVAAPPGPLQVLFGQALKTRGIWRQTLQWVKNNATFASFGADYRWRCEPVLYGWLPNAAHRYYGGRKQDTVWNIDRPMASPEHPTMKPVELVARAIRNSSRTGEIVLDSFLGSGTTLVAAEQTGRIGYGMEIEPKYVAVTLQRLADMGLEPRLASEG